jgi:hypothetical protein
MNKPPVAVAFSFGRGNEHKSGRAMQRAPRATTPATSTTLTCKTSVTSLILQGFLVIDDPQTIPLQGIV